ncbi:MAG: M1 family metallopeptidase [Bacteroidota bacterium]
MGTGLQLYAQNTLYWQQHVDYTMDVEMDVESFHYSGTQKLVYTNHSPDTLNRVFYHLYYNAFQPGSEMDIRLRTIADPDGRMIDSDKKSRIASLSKEEMGHLHAVSLSQDGAKVNFNEEGTILVVDLAKPILPGEKTTLNMTFQGQVPVLVRRGGRNSKEGVALSMSQWYPKMVEYDYEGWHANPYIAREFHGVWGDFDVTLTLDKDYIVGGSGYLQNPREIGYGYEEPGTKVKRPKGKTLSWHFKAPGVHDFVWAADPDYIHDVLPMEDGPVLHFLYQNDPEIIENWKKLQPKTAEMMRFFSTSIGKYPYKQYSVIQGGDGGMEYAMATLITGKRTFGSLVGVTAHEMAHSWFQHLLATNESKHEWMDEGFTTFISSLCMNEIMEPKKENPFQRSYTSYLGLALSGKEQPMTTHADRYALNFAYSAAAYSKGSIFLAQLGYLIGQDKLMEALRKYYTDFKFKHPTPNDFIRIAEKVSGMQLGWYLTDWVQTANTIDYAVTEVKSVEDNKTWVGLERIGLMPMPLDVLVVYKDGSQETFYAPLRMMRGEKDNPYPQLERTVLPDWPWAFPTYGFTLNKPLESIKGVMIDPSQLMADVNGENNVWMGQE